jgi:trehalose/maltose hydrolase-like predicted phosphorylase
VELLEYRHELDIRDAVVVRALRCDRAGRGALRSQRFVSMADVHHAGLEWPASPRTGRPVEIVSAIDGRMVNRGASLRPLLEGRHIEGVGPGFGPKVIALKVGRGSRTCT